MTGAFDPVIEALLAPQERFEAMRHEWAFRAGASLCDLSYANPYDGSPVDVLEAIRAALDDATGIDLQYTPYGGWVVARRKAAEALSASHGRRFGWRDLVLTPGAMAALNVVFACLGTAPAGRPERDEVVIPVPAWLDYPLYAARLGLRPVLVPLDTATLRLDLDRLDAALTPRTRAVVLTQPANPTGLLYSADELADLAAVLDRARSRGVDAWLISDECHRGVIMPGQTFVSPVAHYDRTVVVFSFGKHLAIQGQRIGYAAVSPDAPDHEALGRTLERACRVMGYCTPTALMQRALPALLALRPPIEGIAERRDRVVAGLRDAGYDVVPSQATFFLYPRSPIPDADAFALRLAQRGVMVLPASVFHDAGRFRIALTGSDAMIDRALGMFAEVAA
jgi:aspartate aminotransferase